MLNWVNHATAGWKCVGFGACQMFDIPDLEILLDLIPRFENINSSIHLNAELRVNVAIHISCISLVEDMMIRSCNMFKLCWMMVFKLHLGSL